ncbi:Lrp/AsnC family transcriptional regulator [Erwinia psidii]|uniref:Lrp/AsnC family transcriptional regulator n=1 Tax=Erwinia psidii TaxID=69224 RepID=A0A3N6S0U7_9GAMM|nr:Lrp/AsnC family transcriptional regulator [Erwinia psidii]MCX8957799.1 Lrp/AsnC family transcriptional regulator [Erwinia psidii]MCX8960848.1 Lrp/AsnC family transcriptional regulator [Erwinia psidii]MCX8964912.1 Lrp/AsnC family transcriptional regulator [Erwinia psidii]RQM38417.1 Lrp/AsnC family transcriptional regulator [Erwinia psidii]
MTTFKSPDRTDIRILEHLQREGRCSNLELAEAVSLSPSPCLTRTKRMEQSGIIAGYGAKIALNKLGSHVVVFSEITLSSHYPDDFRTFESGAARYREIVECYNVSGGYDYLLKIIAPNVALFQDLMEHLLQDEIGIAKFANRIVLREPYQRRGEPLTMIATGTASWE